MKSNVELLAPAGSLESFKAVINAGADAVYTGGLRFGARAGADNLNEEQMLLAIDYAHLHNRKVYMTINTLLKDKEIHELVDFIMPFYIHGLDAVIVQDIGVINVIREHFPDLDIHASTQMTIGGVESTKMLKKLGVTRIVTPREFSLEEISAISGNVDIEIESFVHGALCYCYSGQCLLSSVIGGRSGNRGRCAQPCRMPYKFEGEKKQSFLLSTKDMCCINILPEIIESGVYSLKIEGRMKKPVYCAGVVSIYRKYIDKYLNEGKENYFCSDEDYNKLLDLFNRNGFNESYYKQHNGKNMLSLEEIAFRKENKEFTDYITKNYVETEIKEKLNIKLTITSNEPVKIEAECNDVAVSFQDVIPETSEKRPLSIEEVKKQMSKLGNTAFVAGDIQVNLKEGLFLSVGQLKAIRRKTVEEITNKILLSYRREYSPLTGDSDKECNISSNIECDLNSNKNFDINLSISDLLSTDKFYDEDKEDIKVEKYKLSCLVNTIEQFKTVVNNSGVHRIFVESVLFNNYTKKVSELVVKAHESNKKVYFSPIRVLRENKKPEFKKNIIECINIGIDGFLVRSFEEYFEINNSLKDHINKINNNPDNIINNNTDNIKQDDSRQKYELIFDWNIYTFNKKAKEYCNVPYTSPVELNFNELKNRGVENEELIVYGRIPVMSSAGCVLKTTGRCKHTPDWTYITDRLGNEFPVLCDCNYCQNTIYNSKPLSLLGVKSKVDTLKPKSIRLEFTTESEKETKDILNAYVKTFKNDEFTEEFYDFTRGHFNRGVE